MDKRTQIREYFLAKSPKFPFKWILFGIGAFMLGVLIQEDELLAILSIIGFLMGFVPVWNYFKAQKRYQARPSDAQIDTWLQEDFAHLVSLATDKLGFENSQVMSDEITLTGPIIWAVRGVPQEDIQWCVGKDGVSRFAVYRVSIFIIAEKGLGIFNCIYNFIRNVSLNESTDEYFYKNITRVGTREESSNLVLPNGEKLVSSEIFSLDVLGNRQIEIVLSDPAIERYTGGSIPTSRAEKAVNTIRSFVRGKN